MSHYGLQVTLRGLLLGKDLVYRTLLHRFFVRMPLNPVLRLRSGFFNREVVAPNRNFIPLPTLL